jgi:hypothetical protein
MKISLSEIGEKLCTEMKKKRSQGLQVKKLRIQKRCLICDSFVWGLTADQQRKKGGIMDDDNHPL